MQKILALRRSTNGEVIVISKKLVFGKDASASDVALSHPTAVRRHFEILIDRNQLKIADLSGAQGTYINGQRIPEDDTKTLSAGDRVTYGASQEEVFVVVEVKAGNEKVERITNKINWLRTECERIRVKEGVEGLTSNQQKTLEKYENDVKQLEKTLAEELKGSKTDTADEGEISEDAFWDGTVVDDTADELLDLTKKAEKVASKVETYDSLMTKITDLDAESATLRGQIRMLEAEAKAAAEADFEDELDKFMAVNEKTLHETDLEKARRRLTTIDEERKRAQVLAEIARPALSRMRTPVESAASANEEGRHDLESLKSTTDVSAPQATPVSSASTTKATQLFARSNQPKPSAGIGKFRIVQDRVASVEKRHQGDEEETESSPAEDEPAWRPPTNQKGDGTTKANARFGY
jgi:pSer/pThr/pTyr-binding forkhead associated (FHA) protein